MAALLALVATTVLTTLLLFIDTATGAVTQFFVSPLLLIGIPWPVCNLALLSAVYALFAFLLENATATTRLLTADGRPNGKLDEILWLDRTLRHDYGRWPLALAVVIASVSLLTAPGVFAGVAPAWAWALYILTGVTAVRVYHDREKLRNAPTVRPPVLAQLVDNDVRLAPQQVIECLRMSARYRGQLRVLRSSSSRPRAEFPLTGNESWAREFMPDGLLSHVLGSLEIAGVKALYPHQLGALQEVLSDPVDGTRSHVILATGPGSGRRLTAFLATLERTLRRGANVLVITPDEEVLQRERARFRALAERTDWLYALHEGVIPPEWDGRVPDPPYEILHCSIDTLHSTLLKDNRAWAQFFAELELVIVHDLDRYAGVVGANATQVFRRLQLLATLHRSCCHSLRQLIPSTRSTPTGAPAQSGSSPSGFRRLTDQ
jgi:hypothetical protein